MFRNWFFGSQDNEAAYQPIPAEVEQDNTDLFNQIPVDVLAMIASNLAKDDLIAFSLVNKKNYHVYEKYFDHTEAFNKMLPEALCHIASFLPKQDLIPFFLTNKATLYAFEDFKGNAKHGQLRVFMPTNQHSLYQGAEAEVNFRDVNHVLMARYHLQIKLDELEANKDEMQQQEAKRDCMIAATGISLGIAVGIAVHVGGAILLDKVILPACFQHCVHVPGGGSCECGGNVCQATNPAVVGLYPGGVEEIMSLDAYLCCNVGLCYIPAPLIASCPIYCGIGFLIDHCCENLRGERYSQKDDAISGQLRMLDSSRKIDFRSIIILNDQLRERKIGGVVYRMFQPPVEIKMEDEPRQLNHNNDNNAPQVPQRISME